MEKTGFGKLLLVDDEESVRKVLERRFGKMGYECVTAVDGADAVEKVKESVFDAVVTDVKMPVMSGVDMIPHIRAIDPNLSIILLTAFADVDVAIQALRHGAFDFQFKPMEFDRLTLSAANAVERTRLLREKIEYTKNLEEKVRERTAQLEEKNQRLRKFFYETVMALVSAVEAKDKYTEGHSWRVADNAKAVAREMGLGDAEAENIYLAGMLHDIGKIGIPDRVLLKPGIYTDEERAAMQSHPTMTAAILSNVEDFQDIVRIALHHHEKFSGGGYPVGISGSAIPLGARIITVADAFDAMLSTRPYRPKMRMADAIEQLRLGSGSHFDPDAVEKFLGLLEQDAILFETERK
ncbi:MAG: response regulator [Nitrospinae bacterium]|nr:response regulator [Nitrospinota bacterium]